MELVLRQASTEQLEVIYRRKLRALKAIEQELSRRAVRAQQSTCEHVFERPLAPRDNGVDHECVCIRCGLRA